jgi:hypothetical protein
MDIATYRELARQAPRAWTPNPFFQHPIGDWHTVKFDEVVSGVEALLKRFDDGQVTEAQLLRGKDNDARRKFDTLSYWLYYQHHPGHEYWKIIGQKYWSIDAWLSWRAKCIALNVACDGSRNPPLSTLPKRKRDGNLGLVSEHVVPKKALKQCLLRDRTAIRSWLRSNLCCVVTRSEDRRLVRDIHPDPRDPWRRYIGTGIVLLHNPAWTDTEIEPLLKYGLLNEFSMNPLAKA